MPRWPAGYIPVRYRYDELLADLLRQAHAVGKPIDLMLLSGYRSGKTTLRERKHWSKVLHEERRIVLDAFGKAAQLPARTTVTLLLDEDLVAVWCRDRVPHLYGVWCDVQDLLTRDLGWVLGEFAPAALRTMAFAKGDLFEVPSNDPEWPAAFAAMSSEVDELVAQVLATGLDVRSVFTVLTTLERSRANSPAQVLRLAMSVAAPAAAS